MWFPQRAKANESDENGTGNIPGGFQRAMDWKTIRSGDRVIIRKGKTILTGQVDALTFDGSVMWLLSDAGHGRKMYHSVDDNEIWSAPPGN